MVDSCREPNGDYGCDDRYHWSLLQADNENDKTDEKGINVEHLTSCDSHLGNLRE